MAVRSEVVSSASHASEAVPSEAVPSGAVSCVAVSPVEVVVASLLSDALGAQWPEARVHARHASADGRIACDVELPHPVRAEDLPHLEARVRARLPQGAVRLLSVSGVQPPRGQEGPPLQRVEGLAFADAAALAAWEAARAQAEARDHRRLGRELGLFSFDAEVGPGLPLWHPKGARVRKVMEDFWREEHLRRGYGLVHSPHLGRAALWQVSGHLGFYRDGMFGAMEVEGDAFHAKPMNCPFHVKVFQARPRSWRELPLRLAELGQVYRYEPAGALHGLLRVRGFCQDDAHLFCAPEQAEDEVAAALQFALEVLRAFGFREVEALLASRPARSVGDDAGWAFAEGVLRRACVRAGLVFEEDVGGGAFYGPKVDLRIRDALGRAWQCSSVQFDFNLPERFGVEYVGRDGRAHRPVMIHRALFGSLERFFGILLEHHAGALPVWLSPVQVRVLPVSDAVWAHAQRAEAALREAGVRVEVDASGDSLGKQVRRAWAEKVPYVAVLGPKEVEQGALAVRRRGGEAPEPMRADALVERVRAHEAKHE